MNNKKTNRGLILAAAAVTGGVTGSFYMWTVCKGPLAEMNGWTSNEVTLAFSMFTLGVFLFAFINSFVIKKFPTGPVVLVAGLIFSLGWFLVGTAKTPMQLYIYFGLMCGGSDGFIYSNAVSAATKWFPDKKGFANGLCIGCMGGATIIFAPLANWLIETYGVVLALKIVGVILAVCYLIFSLLLKAPEPGWKPEGWEPSAGSNAVSAKDYKLGEALRTPKFYLIFLLFVAAAVSGMMMTGNVSGIGQQLCGMTATQGAMMVSIMALFNFIGRFAFGSLSDKIGRYNTLYIVLVVTAAVMFFGFKLVSGFVGFVIAIGIVGACFGGVMALMPSLTSDALGSRYFTELYAMIYGGYTIASFVGPMVASNCFQVSGNFNSAFSVAGVLTIVGVVFVYLLQKISKKERNA